MKSLEVRAGRSGGLQLRARDDGPGTLFGYALKYNRYSQNLGGFVEQVSPGAVDKSLADSLRVMARYNHDDAFLLGTTDGGTLRLESDGTGMLFDLDLPDTVAGRDVGTLAKRGDVHSSSFAFYALEDEWSLTEQGFPLRTLRAIQLVDVAPVNSPAYLDTSAAVRSLAARTGLDVDQVKDMVSTSAEEIRSRILGEAPAAQGATHADRRPVTQYRRRLDLLRHTL